MTEERSPSGRPVYRHEESAPLELSHGDPDLIAAVEAHVTEHVGEPATAWHQIVSPYVHVDIHVVAPGDRRPAYTLVTSGMAEKPMAGPDGPRYAELVMILPPSWPGPDSPDFEQPRHYWPYRLLQDLAVLPHEYETWLGPGHTIPNGDPPEPYGPGTKLSGALLIPPLIEPDGFDKLTVGDRRIDFLGVVPLHADEMDLKLTQGLDALYDLFDEAGITEILDADRPSLVAPRRRGLFRRR